MAMVMPGFAQGSSTRPTHYLPGIIAYSDAVRKARPDKKVLTIQDGQVWMGDGKDTVHFEMSAAVVPRD